MRYCTKCGSQLENDYVFCPDCGNPVIPMKPAEDALGSEQLRSNNDPVQIVNYYMIAPENAGTTQVVPQRNESAISQQPRQAYDKTLVHSSQDVQGIYKSKWKAWLLCLFLGWLGIHKFYMKRVGMGILYMFTFGLFCIGWIIDIIVILCKPNPFRVK